MARAIKQKEEESYRAYVTDALRAIIGADVRWHDAVRPPEDIDVSEVVAHVESRLGGEQ